MGRVACNFMHVTMVMSGVVAYLNFIVHTLAWECQNILYFARNC